MANHFYVFVLFDYHFAYDMDHALHLWQIITAIVFM